MTEEESSTRGRSNHRSKQRKGETKCRAATALRLILNSTPSLYCNVVGTPCIGLPSIRPGPPQEEAQEEWPLRSERVRAWIGEFFWEQTGMVLRERGITQTVIVLEGKAWHDQRLDLELSAAMDQEPVLEAAVIWMNQNPRFEGTQTKLLEELGKIAKKYGVDTQSQAWPKGPAQLSRRISELESLLKKAGVAVTIGRKPGGDRFVVLDKVKAGEEKPKEGDDVGTTPSQPASVDKSHHPKMLRRCGGGDGDVFIKLAQLGETKGQDDD